MTSTFTPERLRTLLATQVAHEERNPVTPDGTGNHVCNALRDVAPELARELLALKEAAGQDLPTDLRELLQAKAIVRDAHSQAPNILFTAIMGDSND